MQPGQVAAKTQARMQDIARGVMSCNRCGEEQPLDQYYPHASRSYGYVPRCKTCIREQDIQRRYGLDLDAYEVYLRTPCPICGEPSAVLDHCHTSGKVRGGLCGVCNLVLGQMNDDPARLRAAADYLEAHNGC